MRTSLRHGPVVLLALIVAAAVVPLGGRATHAVPAARPDGPRRVSVPFVTNRGQADPSIRFYPQAPHGTVLVTGSGSLIYTLGEGGLTSLTETAVSPAVASVHGVQRAPT